MTKAQLTAWVLVAAVGLNIVLWARAFAMIAGLVPVP